MKPQTSTALVQFAIGAGLLLIAFLVLVGFFSMVFIAIYEHSRMADPEFLQDVLTMGDIL